MKRDLNITRWKIDIKSKQKKSQPNENKLINKKNDKREKNRKGHLQNCNEVQHEQARSEAWRGRREGRRVARAI